MTEPAFALTIDDDLRLLLRAPRFADQMYQLQAADQDRLARWEQWAVGPMTEHSVRESDAAALAGFAAGRFVPTCIEWRGEIVGAASGRIDAWSASAELGYFISSAHEGRGLVTRSVRALIDYLVLAHDVKRCYIQAAVENTRSLAVAERLGFRHEGVLRSAWSIGEQPRVDAALYGLPVGERSWLLPPADR